MSLTRLRLLLFKSIDPSSVKSDGRYTSPQKTWGVYQVKCLPEGKRFHYGNHPIRQIELIRQYGEAQPLWLHEGKNDAKEAVYDEPNESCGRPMCQ